jgi:hypothetical protein
MPLGPRRLTGVRTPVVLLVAFSSVPATLTGPKQPIYRIPFFSGRLRVRELQVHN